MKKTNNKNGIVESLDRGLNATRTLFAFLGLVFLIGLMFALTGVVGGIITLIVVLGIRYAIKSGKMKLY